MHVKFTQLSVHVQDRALAFYTKLLGMSVSKDADYGGGWRWVELGMDGAQTNIVMVEATTDERQDTPALVLVVDDVDAVHEKLVEAGTEIKQEPSTAKWNPNERSAQFYDSEGNLVLMTATSA